MDEQDELNRCRENVRIRPADASAREELAHALLARDQNEAAYAEFREVIRLAPPGSWSRGHAHVYTGDYLAERGQIDEAIEEFRQTFESRPGHPSAHLMLGRLLIATGLRAGAREHWQAILDARANGELPEIHQVT